MKYEKLDIKWLGHAAMLIKNHKTIIIDPYKLGRINYKADIVLITHDHFDHCSLEDIQKIVKPETVVVSSKGCKSKLKDLNLKIIEVKPGDKIDLNGIKIEAVPAYNTNPERLSFHPKSKQYVGYIIEYEGVRIYHAGDTDLIDEMSDFKVDVALLPVSGTYVMDAEEAAEAVKRIKPKLAIPMHYGTIVGSESDAKKFSEMASCKTAVLEREG